MCVSVCKRICSEFENIRMRALKVPENTEEMAQMLDFIHEAKSKGLAELNEKMKVNKPVIASTCYKSILTFDVLHQF